MQQLPKGKGDFRNIFVPHHKDALVVALDFSSQELRVIADYSGDPNMVSCYVGDNLRDMHSLTAAQIAGMDYEEFNVIRNDETHPQFKWANDIRKLAKIVNFASEYGAMAGKMSETLMVVEEEAQRYLDAKYETFKVSEAWKASVIDEVRKTGFVTTKMGVRRHLPNVFSSDKWEAAKAERQAVNFKIQGSSAEMTKMAMGRIHRSGVRQKYDMRFYAQIHDEVVFSIAIADIPTVVPILYQCMTENYGGMTIPIESSVSLGKNFGEEQHELGERVVPTAANLQAKLDQLLAA